MGSSSSKAARGAARKFPAKASGATTAPRPPPPPPSTKPTPSEGVDEHEFSKRLQQMGVVQPSPTFSPSSTASSHLSPESAVAPLGPLFPSAKHNATLSVLSARQRLESLAEEDFEAAGRGRPRRFLDVRTLVRALELRDAGVGTGDIETRLGLEPGLLDKLGPEGMFTHVS